MRTSARYQTAIEIVELCRAQDRPAAQITSKYLRQRRYIGSKDRKIIRHLVFSVIRGRYQIEWYLSRMDIETSARALVFGHLITTSETLDGLLSCCDGEAYSPSPLTPLEQTWLPQCLELSKEPLSKLPIWVRGNFPSWLGDELSESFGSDLLPEMQALDSEAPTDIRVNTTKTNRALLLETLHSLGIQAEPTKYAKNGIHVFSRPALTATEEYRLGNLELQDEGSQIVSELVAAQNGHSIIDFCAGAGGKSLALAENCQPNGRVIACDTNPNRLSKMKPRLTRAGVKNVEIRHIEPDTNWSDGLLQSADRVLIDVPCSGTGTWRRAPDARARLTPEKLRKYRLLQQQIMDTACSLVKPGGRLIYSTCSVLPSENMKQIEIFLDRHKLFDVIPIAPVWLQKIGKIQVPTADTLQLTPKQHGVDGFFVAILERAEEHNEISA